MLKSIFTAIEELVEILQGGEESLRTIVTLIYHGDFRSKGSLPFKLVLLESDVNEFGIRCDEHPTLESVNLATNREDAIDQATALFTSQIDMMS